MTKILSLYFILFFGLVFSQNFDFKVLEKQISSFNQNQQFKKSQDILFSYLNDSHLSDTESAQVYLLLAKTYRILNDFPTTINFLENEKKYTKDLSPGDELVMKLDAELAFTYFDYNNYEKADETLKSLRKRNFKGLEEWQKAYLIMQDGFSYFQKKDLTTAENLYTVAEQIIHKNSICDLPVVWVKKMQLAEAEKDHDKVDVFYKKSMKSADSCNIPKYKIYATDEYVRILNHQQRKDEYNFYKERLDSIKFQYDRDDKVSELHIDKTSHFEELATKENKKANFTIISYIISSILFLLLVYWLYKRNFKVNKEKKNIEEELNQMRMELKAYIHSQDLKTEADNKNQQEQDTQLPEFIENDPLFDRLTTRQKDLFTYIFNGYSNKEIAEKLFITEATVKYHIRNIYEIMEIKNRREFLFKYAKYKKQ